MKTPNATITKKELVDLLDTMCSTFARLRKEDERAGRKDGAKFWQHRQELILDLTTELCMRDGFFPLIAKNGETNNPEGE